MLRNNFADQWLRLVPILLIVSGLAALAVVVVANLMTLGSVSALRANQLALALAGFALLLAGIVAVSSGNQQRIGKWLLVSAAVLAVTMAANLLIVGSFPGSVFRQVMVLSVVFSVLYAGTMPITLPGEAVAGVRGFAAVDKVKVVKFIGLVIQLGLLVLVIRQFEIENQALYANLMPLIFYGFVIHYFLPAQFRLAFFLFLSLAAIMGVMGLLNGLYLIGIGLGLIAICHLPFRFSVRIGILSVAVLLLVLIRSEWLPTAVPGVVWPVLGSMFMFRLILYLYDLKHSKAPTSFLSAISYFFLLPNVVFLLFPLVDYGLFRRTYYDDEEHNIYQTGMKWMFWGVVHLLLYRFVNYYLVISPREVVHAGDLVRYIVPNYLLLLRVSGQFHLIVGILHLFGFNLPRTFREYFVANSFTDFWRRANPYWRDFMVKIFYYPVYFRLERFETMSRIALATVIVFIATWFLHAYQWYWLRGSFLFTAPDISFWALFGVAVLINSLIEAKKGRKRTLGRRVWTWRDAVSVSLSTIGTFAIVAVLYSLWTSASLEEWLSLWRALWQPLGSIINLWPLFLVLAVLTVGGIWTHLVRQESVEKRLDQPAYFRAVAVNGFLILAVFLIGNPAVYAQIGRQMPEPIADLRTSRLSARDADLLLQGYYENLIGVNRFNSELWEIYSKRPADWPLLQDTELAEMTGDFRIIELVPSTRIMFHGAMFSVNEWGMRGRNYDLVPPTNTFRIAVVGPSFVMGSGVADSEVFTVLLEDRLNNEFRNGPSPYYEVLNFGMAGHSALQELWLLESRVLDFQPQAVLFVSHQQEEEIAVRNLANRIQNGIELPYDYLNELALRAQVDNSLTQAEIQRLLQPYGKELVSWTYERVVMLAQERDFVPIWVFMPILEAPLIVEEQAKLIRQAAEAGFITLDLGDTYTEYDHRSLVVAEWDMHPNAKAHTLIANQLFEAFTAADGAMLLGKPD